MATSQDPRAWNEFCCDEALFLRQLQHFMNMECLINTVAMATFTRCLLTITATLIDKICYYASRMNGPSLNDSKKKVILTLFKCVLLNILQNDVRSLLSAEGPILKGTCLLNTHFKKFYVYFSFLFFQKIKVSS